MENFKDEARKIEEEVLKLRLNPPPWTHIKTHKNLEMFSKPSLHFHGHVYKFVTELDFPHDIVYEVMKPPPTMEEKSWDKSLKYYERLATISEDIAIGLLITPSAALGFISKREFIDLQVFKTYPSDELNENYGEICWIFGKGIDFPGRPPAKDCVRGTNYPGGYAVAKNKRNPNKCFVELYVNCDIGGTIPKSLIEAYLPHQQIAYLDYLKTEVKKRFEKRRK